MISLINDLTVGAAGSLIALYVTTAAAIFVGVKKRPLAASSKWTLVDQEESSKPLFLHTVIIWNRSKRTLADSDFIRRGQLSVRGSYDEFVGSNIEDIRMSGIFYPKYTKKKFSFEYWQDSGWLVFRMISDVANPGLKLNFKDSGREIFWVTSDRFTIKGIIFSLFLKFVCVIFMTYIFVFVFIVCWLVSFFTGLGDLVGVVAGISISISLIWFVEPLRRFGKWLISDTLDDVASVLCRPSARGLTAMNEVINEFEGSARP